VGEPAFGHGRQGWVVARPKSVAKTTKESSTASTTRSLGRAPRYLMRRALTAKTHYTSILIVSKLNATRCWWQ